MTLDAGDYDQIVAAIYQAALDPAHWRTVIDLLDQKLDSVYLSLYGHDAATNLYLGSVVSKYGEDYLDLYASGLGERSPFVSSLSHARQLLVAPSEAWVPRDVLEKSELYADFLRPQEDVVTGGGGVVCNDDDRLVILSGQVRRRDGEAKSRELLEAVARLIPHVRRAFEISRHLEGTALLARSCLSAFDARGEAAFLVDLRGRVIERNAAADRMLARGHLVRATPDGVIRLGDPEAQRAFSAALGAIRQSDSGLAACRGVLRSPAGTVATYRLMPAPSDGNSFLRSPRAPLLLLIRASGACPRETAGLLNEAFGATPAEAELGLNLLRGLSLAEHAAERGVAVNTVRVQLKSLYRKTGTGRQGELVALLARLAG